MSYAAATPTSRHSSGLDTARMSAGEILEPRFAEGELSAEEYRERRSVLTNEPTAGASAS
jgi:uncharacterized membrane protein